MIRASKDAKNTIVPWKFNAFIFKLDIFGGKGRF